MQRYVEWLVRHPWRVIALTLVVTALAVVQARSIKVVIDTTKLMPQSNPYVSTSNEVERRFGSKHVVVIGIAPRQGDIYQPAVLAMVQRVTARVLQVPGVVKDNVLSLSARRAKHIIGHADALEVRPLLASGPADEQHIAALREAIERNPVYRNAIVSADGRLAAILVEFKDEPSGFAAMMAKVEAAVSPERGELAEILVGGLPSFLAQVERYSERMAVLLPVAIIVLGGVLYLAFRTWQGMLLPLTTALLAVLWGVGVMGAMDIPMDVFNSTTPILILAVATGHAVQLLKRYQEDYAALRQQGGLAPADANRRAVVSSLTRVGPVTLAAGSVAALGFVSLVVFEISAVRTFGVFTALGIVATVILELSFIPALRSILRPAPARGRSQARWSGVTGRIAALVTGPRRRRVYALTAVLVVVACLGMLRIVEDNSVKRYFSAAEQFQRDDQLLNQSLGGTNTMYLLIEGRDEDAIKQPAVLHAMARLQQMLEAQPGVGKTVSIADFVKRMNQAMHGDDPSYDRIPDSQALISQYLLLYAMSGEPGDFDAYVDSDYRHAKLAVYVRTDSTAYTEALVAKVKAFADPLLAPHAVLRIGGSAPQDAALNEAMVKEKLLNIAQIAAVVLVVSSAVFRSLTAGCLVLLPLLLAVVANFGLMGWSGILLNIPTSLTSAMAVGIGADYAIYLLFRLREAFERGADEVAAVHQVLHSAGEAILFVATAVAAGYGVLLLSPGFHIHQWLAVLIGSAMLVSALSALVLIPLLVLAFRPAFLYRRQHGRRSLGGATLVVLSVLGGVFSLPHDARAAEVDLVQLMERNHMVGKVADSTTEATFTLTNRAGSKRVRKVHSATRLQANGRDNMRVTRFLAPPDVKGTVSLLIEHAQADDDLWIYLPALKKVRRLVSSNKKDSFVGTDFSYADVIGYRTADWNYRLVGEEALGGQPCYVVEATPKTAQVQADTGYSKRIDWIRRDNSVTLRSEYWDAQGDKLKVSSFSDVQLVDPVRERWQAMRLEANNLQTGHQTAIVFEHFKANQQIAAEQFTVAAMERE